MAGNKPLNILIIGCSVAGPALATFLLLGDSPDSQKPHVTILERASSLRTQGQNVDIRGAGITLIKKLGLEKAIRANKTGEEGVQWVDADNRVWASFGADKTGELSTPTADIEILRGALAKIMYERSKSISDEVKSNGGHGIEYIFGDTADTIIQDGEKVRVTFTKSKETRDYDIVVGADGLQSKTRRTVWNTVNDNDVIKRFDMYGGYFSMPKAPSDPPAWRRWYRAPGRRFIMLRPDEQHGRTTVHIAVLNSEDKRLPELATKGYEAAKEQKAILAEYFKDAGWESDRVLKEMESTSDFYYDMIAQVHMESVFKGRVVLIGDAGFCASPMSGMGTTLALVSAYQLAGGILKNSQDLPATFKEYEDYMFPIVTKAQKLAPGAPGIFVPETEWGIWFLNLVMYCISSISAVAKLIFKYAGPPAKEVKLTDYRLRDLPEMAVP